MKIQVLPNPRGFLLKTLTSALSLSVDSSGALKISSPSSSSSDEVGGGGEDQQSTFADALLGVVRGVSQKCYYLIMVDESAAVESNRSDDSLFGARSIESIQVIPFPSKFMCIRTQRE